MILEKLLRPNIRDLVAYSSARSEYNADGVVYIDANENSLGSALNNSYNRYPDPLQGKLKQQIAALKAVPAENIFLGNGSDEPIDLLIRSFCTPGKDNVIIFPPTYGMYEVAAQINDVEVKRVLLNEDFQVDVPGFKNIVNEDSKLVFICSPNNPTGNIIDKGSIIAILENFSGIVVLDEAYIDFAQEYSFAEMLLQYPNLVILQTFSKAWGLAGLRLGMAFASKDIIAVLNKVKAPYNINIATQDLAANALSSANFLNESLAVIVSERNRLQKELEQVFFVKQVFSSDANFLLVRVDDANNLYKYLRDNKVIVRNRSTMPLCSNTLRITVGSPEENNLLIDLLNQYNNA